MTHTRKLYESQGKDHDLEKHMICCHMLNFWWLCSLTDLTAKYDFFREHEHHFEELSWCDTSYISRITCLNNSRNSLSDPLHRRELDDGIWQCVKTNNTPGEH